jgi:hypothetical protein
MSNTVISHLSLVFQRTDDQWQRTVLTIAIYNLDAHQLNWIHKLVQEHQEQLLVGWNDFFND